MSGRGKQAGRPPGSSSVTSVSTGSVAERQQAFERYIEPEIAVLLRVAQTLTGSWTDAEDLVQDTLVRAYRGIDRFDGAHPRAWLLTILRRAHLNSLRRRRPDLLGTDVGLEHHRPAFGSANAPSPEQMVTEHLLSAELQRAVDNLDPRFRTVLLLIDVDQLGYAEVAGALGIAVGTVMSRLSRARARVRTQLRTTQPSGRIG